MKIVFILIVMIHGLIHLMGFLKAFGIGEISQLTSSITKSSGVFWLFVSVLFIGCCILISLKKEWWPILAIITVIFSQIIIILSWKDAKYGTIANVIVLLVSFPAYGKYQFNRMVTQEVRTMLQPVKVSDSSKIGKDDIDHLPDIVQKWMEYARVIGSSKIYSVRLKQTGKMRTQPDNKWMSFNAEQYFDINNPSFIWITDVKAMPAIHMSGRDKMIHGEGEMLIKLLSLVPVVNEGRNEKINSGSMLRYLAEMSWFPSAALSEDIAWEGLDNNTAKATLTIGNQKVSGIFKFSNEGAVISFEADRYYGGGKSATLEKWRIENIAHRNFNGFTIPYKSKVSWELPDGDFHWLTIEITDIAYNKKELYQ